MVGIIRQDDIIIPSGGSVIRPEDRVVILARGRAIAELEKMLSGMLEHF